MFSLYLVTLNAFVASSIYSISSISPPVLSFKDLVAFVKPPSNLTITDFSVNPEPPCKNPSGPLWYQLGFHPSTIPMEVMIELMASYTGLSTAI